MMCKRDFVMNFDTCFAEYDKREGTKYENDKI